MHREIQKSGIKESFLNYLVRTVCFVSTIVCGCEATVWEQMGHSLLEVGTQPKQTDWKMNGEREGGKWQKRD